MKIKLFSVLSRSSFFIKSSSYSFSPGLKPVSMIFISLYGSKPESLIIFSASSNIFTGLPISSTKSSPFFAIAPEISTSCAASGIVIKYLMILLSVKVTGPPFAICLLNNGITEPLEPKTFPNLVAEKFVLLFLLCTIISHIRFVAPITFVGLTALSVEIIVNFSTPYFSETSTIFNVPNTLFLTDSQQLCSISGTCL